MEQHAEYERYANACRPRISDANVEIATIPTQNNLFESPEANRAARALYGMRNNEDMLMNGALSDADSPMTGYAELQDHVYSAPLPLIPRFKPPRSERMALAMRQPSGSPDTVCEEEHSGPKKRKITRSQDNNTSSSEPKKQKNTESQQNSNSGSKSKKQKNSQSQEINNCDFKAKKQKSKNKSDEDHNSGLNPTKQTFIVKLKYSLAAEEKIKKIIRRNKPK
jgi:hypothetical protein